MENPEHPKKIHVHNTGSMKGVVVGGKHNTVHMVGSDIDLTLAAADLRRLAQACEVLGEDEVSRSDALTVTSAAEAAERHDPEQVRTALERLSRWGSKVAEQIGVGLLVQQLLGL